MQKYSFHLICHHPNENLFFNTFAVEVRFMIYKVQGTLPADAVRQEFTIGLELTEKYNFER